LAYGIVAANDPVNKIDPSGRETLVNVGLAMAVFGILAAMVVRGISLTKTQNNTQSDGDTVYRGLSAAWFENPLLIRFVGISSKGMYPYAPSEHIESTKDDTAWISASGSKEITQYYASFGRKMVAVIDLNKKMKKGEYLIRGSLGILTC